MFGKSKRVVALEGQVEALLAENSTLKAKAAENTKQLLSQRHNYKNVWTDLSSDLERAVAHVIGPVDEETIRREAENTANRIEASVGVLATDTILEIGSGIGRVGMVLAPRCKKWIGCDVSANMLKYSQERLKEYKNVEHVEISGYDLCPVADQSIDLVYCTVVFMHLDEWDRYNYILEAMRVLKTGGRLFVDNFSLATPEGWNVFEIHRKLKPEERPGHISKASTVEELQIFLERAGFSAVTARNNEIWAEAWGTK